jgi:hypothetical protein
MIGAKEGFQFERGEGQVDIRRLGKGRRYMGSKTQLGCGEGDINLHQSK